jgi:tRNA A-37 threonylcarbamoyl transferase component Bud32
MNIFCANCGRLNRPGARYCATCQAPLSATAACLQQGQSLDGGAYRVVRPLDRGGMGAVWLVAQTKAFDRLAVLKEVIEYFDPADAGARRKALERFEAEARTLGNLKHPGIPDLYAYFTEGGHNYLVMEYIEGPDLHKWLTRQDSGAPIAADEVLRYTIQVCEVLEYLARHRPPVIHNDIKPENIIVDEHSGRAVLVDFGTAKPHPLLPDGRPNERTPSIYGTVGYAAPELYQNYAEPRSDVYSLAATAYCLLTGGDPRAHPFQYPHLTTQTLPPALADILRAALAHEIGDRPAVTQFRQQLQQYAAGQDLVTAGEPHAAGPGDISSVTIAREGIVPAIQVTPNRLDFGTLSHAAASVVYRSFTVTNVGQVMAQCDVRGIPRWLRARPRAFCLVPGARQEVEIGLIEQRIPGQKQQIVLTIALEGGQNHKVYVSLQMEGFLSALARLARFLTG